MIGNISSWFSLNSEANIWEFRENIEEMVMLVNEWIHSSMEVVMKVSVSKANIFICFKTHT